MLEHCHVVLMTGRYALSYPITPKVGISFFMSYTEIAQAHVTAAQVHKDYLPAGLMRAHLIRHSATIIQAILFIG